MTVLLLHISKDKQILALADMYGHILAHQILIEQSNVNYSVVIKVFLSLYPQIDLNYACIAYSGSVNIFTPVEIQLLKEELDLEAIITVKDTIAQACGLHLLHKNQFFVLKKGEFKKGGNRSFLLIEESQIGESVLAYPDTIIDSNGGFCDFIPLDDVEYLLQKFVKEERASVFYNDILSESGLLLICKFLYQKMHYQLPKHLESNFFISSKAIEEVVRLGCATKTPIFSTALRIFLKILGAKVRNHILQFDSTAGVFLSGNILIGMKKRLKEDTSFNEGLYRKDSSDVIVADTSVQIINDLLSPLYGAHCYLFEKISD
ncbi:hypothetical protein CLAVI_000928 [Candidatus Clavichlamydia salmonicola]|uniref:glucokinase n=1 Tax=Candidatus Clavichlamydia salmonicola TaxID=469812 RepID=UPI001891ACBA|nr:glucokinase [Candidatus Clavichlamydia salmonicola]MBF5051287.1 hypothetical protein [Candidatus Clavichlamydia salmonicola]